MQSAKQHSKAACMEADVELKEVPIRRQSSERFHAHQSKMNDAEEVS
jgi:hypothetical protein